MINDNHQLAQISRQQARKIQDLMEENKKIFDSNQQIPLLDKEVIRLRKVNDDLRK